MDASVCRSQLERLLRDETTLLQLLEQQLDAEHGLLKSNDIEGLERAGTARQDTVAKLLRIDDERRQLCRLQGRGDDNAAMGALLRWCDAGGSLLEAYQRSAAQAQRCREHNDRNGALVTARLNRVGDMLRQLNPSGNDTRTYAPRQSVAPTQLGAGRMLTVRA
jgi:flagellar biosynthesis/type III secretory pathway chaperone